MVPTAQKPGLLINPGQEKKKEKKKFPAAFSKYKFYLDIKASKVKSSLLDDIAALGGSLVEFLTKEVTHVISEGPEWKFLLVSNGTSCGPPSPWTPGATPSPSASWDGDKSKKVKSRADHMLNATRTPERSAGCSDVLEIAKKFKCHIWSLNKTLAWLTKFKSKYGNLHSGQKPSQVKHKERDLRDPFLKLDSSIRYARPSFSEFKTWPRISLDGWAGSSPFSEQRKKQKKKSFPGRFEPNRQKEEDPSLRKKECSKKKDGGFCEICNKSFSALDSHLRGELHTKFVQDINNWMEVDCKIGEVLECLPPGKAYRRKRYNSFDANKALESGNEENVAPLAETGPRCDLSEIGMKSRENGILETEAEPQVLTIRRKTRGSEDESRKDSTDPVDEDDEVSFNPDTVNTLVENGITNGDESTGKSKSKRKSSAEKFLEDNASYFQLEVLSSKTRSSKTFETNGETSEKEPVGFHNSFLDFLKSKGVEGKDEEPGERSRSRHKSGPSGGIQRKSRPRTSSCRHSPVRSDSEDSVRAPRSRSQYSKVRSRTKRSRSRDYSPSESEPEVSNGKLALSRIRKKEKTPSKCIDSSDDESEGSYTKSTRSRTKTDSVCSPSPGKKSRRSELDKLLEAVDTSFHFETAAAAAKRISGSQELGPLEIDVSDSNIESGDEKELVSKNKKRKHSESDTEPEGKRKKKKNGSGDLLKTFSPRLNKKSPKVNKDSDHEIEETGEVWDGWETLNQTLAATDSLPVEADKLHFSFEATPFHESWFQTYSRQDRGEDVVFYPESKSFPFMLPYELPYSTFMPYKPEGKQDENLKKKGVKKNLLGDSEDTLPLKKKKKKVSEYESTDSENNKKGKSKLGPKADHLLDLHPRISPRCHASTKVISGAILHEGPHLTDEELAEALLIQDERDFHFPSFVPFLNHDETSNDSLASAKHFKRENIADFVQIASSMDRYLRNTETLTEVDLSAVATPSKLSQEKGSDKVTVPTRSRISSEELLKTMKDKPKKKKDKLLNGNVVLDQVVADHVDAILLDCLEEELPTIPFESEERETISLLDSYQSCNSMNVCNSRWLRPSRPSVLGNQKDGSTSFHRKSVFPFKPKRLVIYKEDLPGFKFDNDIETEKLPVSKRFLAKSAQQEEAGSGEEKGHEEESKTVKKEKKVVKKSIKKEVFISRKEKLKVEPKEEKDEDDVSLPDSSAEPSPRAKTKSKQIKTGLTVTKNKTKLKPDAVVTKKTKKVPTEKKSPNEKKTEKKVKESVQPKTDKLMTKKKSGSPRSSSSRQVEGRRTALQAKNYSEIESDTESLFESKVPYRSPHMKLLKQKPISSKSKTKTK